MKSLAIIVAAALPADFAAQMEWLKRASSPRSGSWSGSTTVPDVLERASPVLARLRMPAIAYVITGRTSSPDPSFLTWKNLRYALGPSGSFTLHVTRS